MDVARVCQQENKKISQREHSPFWNLSKRGTSQSFPKKWASLGLLETHVDLYHILNCCHMPHEYWHNRKIRLPLAVRARISRAGRAAHCTVHCMQQREPQMSSGCVCV